MLDLRDLRALEIDPHQRTAWAETELTAGAYTTAAAYGLATGFGDTASVGIGGITGRRHRVAGQKARPDHRRPAGRRGGDRRRPPAAGGRPDPPGPCSGRSAVAAATSASPPGSGSACTSSTRSSAACCCRRPRHHRRLRRRGRGRAGGAVDDRQHPARPAAAVRARRTPWQAGGDGHPRLRRRRRRRPGGRGAVAGARHPITDLVCPIPYPQIYPPEDEGFHPTAASRTMFVDAGTATGPQRSSSSWRPRPPRCGWRNCGSWAAPWRGCPPRPPPSPTAPAGSWSCGRAVPASRGGRGPPGLGRPLGRGPARR